MYWENRQWLIPGFQPAPRIAFQASGRLRGCRKALLCPASDWLPEPTVFLPGPLWPDPSPFKPRLTWRRSRIWGPCGPGDPSTAPCGLVWGTFPLGASLVPGAGRWPDSQWSETQWWLSTSDHTWPRSEPVGVNQSGITGVQSGWHFWKEKWSGRGSDGHIGTSGWYKRALYTRKGTGVARGSADRDRKSGLTKNKTIDAIVACKGREDLRPMEEYGSVGNWGWGLVQIMCKQLF